MRDEYAGLSGDEIRQRLPEIIAYYPALLERLSYREREVLKVRYGVGDIDAPHSLMETARVFKVTRERIRQLDGKAITRIQSLLRAEGLTGAS